MGVQLLTKTNSQKSKGKDIGLKNKWTGSCYVTGAG